MFPLRFTTLLLAAAFALAPGLVRADVVINEVMYHSSGDPEVEYIELVNTGPDAQDLTGWTLIDGFAAHTPCVLVGTLEPGEFIVVVNVLEWFTDAYPGIDNINPNPFGSPSPDIGFGLGNNSEEIFLSDADGLLVDEIAYLDDPPWPPEPDGSGPSLELINPHADNTDVAFWRASTNAGAGTPGFQNSVFVADLPPALTDARREPALPTSTDAVVVTVRAADEVGLSAVTLHVDVGAGFTAVPMLDDGLHDDGAAGDGTYGATIGTAPTGTTVRYYVAAIDPGQQTATLPRNAPAAWLAYTVDHQPPPLRINEILASNLTGILDGAGDADDWLELRNPGPLARSLTGMFLTIDLGDGTMWELPDVILQPGERLLIWCDGQPLQGPFHASFTLPRAGGAVSLFGTVAHGNTLVHGFTYGPQSADIAFGYLPEDSGAPEYLATPTPRASNAGSAYFSPICINEFLATSGIGVDDWVELYNRGTATLDVSGWHVSDNPANTTRYTLPAGTVMAPGEFLFLDQPTLGFGFAADGTEVLALTRPGGAAGADWFDMGPQLRDVSQGRFTDGTPNWHFFSAWTAATPNHCQSVAAPAAVRGFVLDDRETAAWQPVEGATGYDVAVGDLAALRGQGGDFSTAILGCGENDSEDVATWLPEVPSSGDALFFLVRATNDSCGFGSWDPVVIPAPGSRDPTLDTAPASCP